jgi:hypothetical protein
MRVAFFLVDFHDIFFKFVTTSILEKIKPWFITYQHTLVFTKILKSPNFLN